MENEIEHLVKKSYLGITAFLKTKYGSATYDYFYNESCDSVNTKTSRMNEGLYCHHIDEDKAIKLSSIENAKKNPYEYQRADRLVYCNILEHMLLHLKIILEPKHKDANMNEIQGFGGVFTYICPLINDYLSGFHYRNEKKKIAFDIIPNLFKKYVFILRWFFSEYDKDRENTSVGLKLLASTTMTGNTIVKSVYNSLITPDDIDKISTEELEELEQASANGDYEKTFELGQIYLSGKRVIIDRQKAFNYFYESAKKDYVPSVLKTAYLLENGIGVKKDVNQAIEFYEKAIQLGNVVSYLSLEKIFQMQDRYEDAIVANQNLISLTKGQIKYEKAVLFAYRNLNSIFSHGKWDNKLAIKWYTKQIENGDMCAMYNLGKIYMSSKKTSKNIARAIEWLERAYNNNFYEALIDLGDMYTLSDYKLFDVNKGLMYYDRAGDLGIAKGYSRLVSYYRSHKNSEECLIKANEYAEKVRLMESKDTH